MFWFNETVSNYTALLSGKSWLAPDGNSIGPKPVFITYSFQSRMTDADKDATARQFITLASIFKERQGGCTLGSGEMGCGLRYQIS